MDATTKSNQPDPSSVRAAARLLYESSLARLVDVADEFKVTQRTIANWSAADAAAGSPWQKKNSPQITERAKAIADEIASATADVVDEVDRQQALAELRETAAVDQRAAIIARHRAEVSGPRALAYEGMRKRDMDLIRMAKTAAEALKVTQDLERRSWNIIDAGDVERGNTVVVIERG